VLIARWLVKDSECRPNDEWEIHLGGGSIHSNLHAKCCSGFIRGSVCFIQFCNIFVEAPYWQNGIWNRGLLIVLSSLPPRDCAAAEGFSWNANPKTDNNYRMWLMITQYFILLSFLFLRTLINYYVYAVEYRLVLYYVDSKNPGFLYLYSFIFMPFCIHDYLQKNYFFTHFIISKFRSL